ncbi:MAG: hypothetical protein IV086_07110 [Hyphomonadaceae bacterium]|nr:hypothetical protein [Hyphomonadaceae bacterium]
MIDILDMMQRAHLPLLAVAIVAGLGVAAASRDLGKRLLGVCVAALAGVTELAVLTRHDPALASGALAACVMVLGGAAQGVALLVRVREDFGGVDAGGLRVAELSDDRAERGE